MFKKLFYLLLILTLVFSLSSFVGAETETEVETENPEEFVLEEEIAESAEGDIFYEALTHYNQGNYSLAEEKFYQLLEREDLSEGLEFSVLYYSTMTAIQKNQTGRAVDFLNEMNNLGYQSGPLNWRIGELYLNKNNQFDSADFSEAQKYLERAAELGVRSFSFQRDLAYAYRENEEIENAQIIYEQLLNNDPTAADYINLAMIKENKGQRNEAVQLYESAVDLDSTESALYLNLGNLYQELNNYNSAVAVFKQGIKNSNNFAPYYIGLGESYLALENYGEAETALKRAVEINRNSYYGYFLLGNIEKERNNHNEALNYYSQSLKHNPDYVDAYLAEGRVHLEREEYYRAISRFSLAVEKNTTYAESRYYLGLAYYNADMLEAARAELRRALHISDSYQEARDLLDQVEIELNIN